MSLERSFIRRVLAECPGGAANACNAHGEIFFSVGLGAQTPRVVPASGFAGTCSEGISGTGTCACFRGYFGSECQCVLQFALLPESGAGCRYSREATCQGRGDPDASGNCKCDTGFAGPNCKRARSLFARFSAAVAGILVQRPAMGAATRLPMAIAAATLASSPTTAIHASEPFHAEFIAVLDTQALLTTLELTARKVIRRENFL